MNPYQENIVKKPDAFRNKIIRLVGDLPRIELFARINAHDWDSFGNDTKLTQPKLILNNTEHDK